MRKKRYALETMLGNKRVNKKASSPESIWFLEEFLVNYEYISKEPILNNGLYQLVETKRIGDEVWFRFVTWKSLEEIFSYKNKDIKAYTLYLKKFSTLLSWFQKRVFTHSDIEKFNTVFWEIEVGSEWIACWMVDLIFSNILIDDTTWVWNIIDYEWVFDFPLPVNYLIRRAIRDNLLKWVYLFDIVHYSVQDELKYITWEKNFQNYVSEKKHYYSLEIAKYYIKKLFAFTRFKVTKLSKSFLV